MVACVGAAETKTSESSNNLELRCPFYFVEPLQKNAPDSFDRPRNHPPALQSKCSVLDDPRAALCLPFLRSSMNVALLLLTLPPTYAPLHIMGEFHLFAFHEWNHERTQTLRFSILLPLLELVCKIHRRSCLWLRPHSLHYIPSRVPTHGSLLIHSLTGGRGVFPAWGRSTNNGVNMCVQVPRRTPARIRLSADEWNCC